jgi:phenylpyruvate tautomerase PptA (4-oxalocrotonate tautomerase family)
MPTIHLFAFKRPIEKKRQLVKDITAVVCKNYEIEPDIVTVCLFDTPTENVAHGGILESDNNDSNISSMEL